VESHVEPRSSVDGDLQMVRVDLDLVDELVE
jgi:hypothetical protein